MLLKIIFFSLVVLVAPVSRAYALDIIGVKEVRPGMKGHGMTVFQGTSPERFDVEVIDVMHNIMPDQDVILVRCSGHGLESSRIAAGMSGSPVYLDGRLAGAIAFTWAFSKEPIGGVTPIESMLEEARSPSSFGIRASAESPHTGLSPISTPLIVSGAGPGSLAELEETLKPYNFVPVPGGSGSGGEESPNLEMGSAIGAQLVSGDVNITAVGTVSYIEGSTVIAFGHGFLGAGRLSVPITTAKIHTIVDSQFLSFKVASPIKAVGALEQDLSVGIFGRIGAKADMVPFEINVNNKTLGQNSDYHFDIVSHQILTFAFLRYLLFQALNQSGQTSEPSTVDVRTEFKLENYPPIVHEDTYYTIANSFSVQSLEAVQLLLMNPFEYAPLDSVKIDMTINPALDVAVINSAWINSQEVYAGETAEVHVLLKPFNRPETEEVISIPVPETVQGTLSVQIAGGSAVPPDVAAPQGVDDLIAALQKIYPSKSLVAFHPVDGQAVDYGGTRLHKLPPSMAAALNPSSSNRAKPRREMTFQVKETPYIILGNTRINVQVLPPKSR